VISKSLKTSFEKMSKRSADPIEIEIHQPDRRALDEVVFDVLGLTVEEREAGVDLVRARRVGANGFCPLTPKLADSLDETRNGDRFFRPYGGNPMTESEP